MSNEDYYTLVIGYKRYKDDHVFVLHCCDHIAVPVQPGEKLPERAQYIGWVYAGDRVFQVQLTEGYGFIDEHKGNRVRWGLENGLGIQCWETDADLSKHLSKLYEETVHATTEDIRKGLNSILESMHPELKDWISEVRVTWCHPKEQTGMSQQDIQDIIKEHYTDYK